MSDDDPKGPALIWLNEIVCVRCGATKEEARIYTCEEFKKMKQERKENEKT